MRLYGEVLPMDISPRARGYTGMWKRVPVGPCSFITPWNFPLNLPAHKIAPALAVGCPFILKPASWTPVGALVLGEILAETPLPRGAFSILPCRNQDAAPHVEDERLKLLSFTGSQEVGWDLKRRAGKNKVTLELGGNAACLVDADTDLDDAVQRIVFGAFYQSGQRCVSVQRNLAHTGIYDSVRAKLVQATGRPRTRRPEGRQDLEAPDGGSSLRGALKGWFKHGVCGQSFWPELEEPGATGKADWWDDGVRRPLGAYYRVDSRSVV